MKLILTRRGLALMFQINKFDLKLKPILSVFILKRVIGLYLPSWKFQTQKKTWIFLKGYNRRTKSSSPCIRPGVNFINILRAAFTHVYPKSANRNLSIDCLLCFLESACVKASRKHIGEIDPKNLKLNSLQGPHFKHLIHRVCVKTC